MFLNTELEMLEVDVTDELKDVLGQEYTLVDELIQKASALDYSKIKKVTGAVYDKKTSTWTL